MADDYISGEEHQAIKHSKTSNTKKVTMQVNYLIIAGVVVILCGLSFYGGLAYQKHKSPSTVATNSSAASGRSGSGFGSGSFGGHRAAGGSAGFGQVTSVSSTSITVSNARSGADKTYAINASTAITDDGQTAAVSSIQTGETVIISTSSTAPTVATRILVNPSFGGGPSAQGSGSQTTD